MKVRHLRDGEERSPCCAGYFVDKFGNKFILTNQQADCVAALWSLRHDRNLQIEYLKYVFLYELFGSPSMLRETQGKNPQTVDEFHRLQDKFHRTWNTNAQNVLVGDDAAIRDLNRHFDGQYSVDESTLDKIMDDIDTWSIVLHHRLDVNPGRNVLVEKP
jgi:hypothetical protein